MLRKALAFVAVAGALVLLGMSGPARHTVYDRDAAEFGIDVSTNITERQLTIDATFTGVAREKGRLFSTYDRSAPPTKRACPT